MSILTDIFRALHSRTRGGEGLNYNDVAGLSDEKLLELKRSASNFVEEGFNAIRMAGELLSAHGDEHELYHNGAGWMVMHLADNLQAVTELEWVVDNELIRRGYDNQPKPEKVVRHGR